MPENTERMYGPYGPDHGLSVVGAGAGQYGFVDRTEPLPQREAGAALAELKAQLRDRQLRNLDQVQREALTLITTGREILRETVALRRRILEAPQTPLRAPQGAETPSAGTPVTPQAFLDYLEVFARHQYEVVLPPPWNDKSAPWHA